MLHARCSLKGTQAYQKSADDDLISAGTVARLPVVCIKVSSPAVVVLFYTVNGGHMPEAYST